MIAKAAPPPPILNIATIPRAVEIPPNTIPPTLMLPTTAMLRSTRTPCPPARASSDRDTVSVPETRGLRLNNLYHKYMLYISERGAERMFQSETRVLVILPRDLVDRGRVLAGRATTSMRLPVSLQIVLRALIEEGLKRRTDPGLLANVSRQALTVRRIRQEARRRTVGATPRAAAPPRRRSS